MTGFLIACGGLLVFAVLIFAWLFRTTAAPLWTKILAPSVAAGVACWLPFSVNSMMGFPIQVAELPSPASLVAFVPHDEEKTVDVWLISPPATDPRAYATPMTDGLKKALREAQEAMGKGERATLVRKQKGRPAPRQGHGDALGIGDDDSNWQLLVEDPLPPKE